MRCYAFAASIDREEITLDRRGYRVAGFGTEHDPEEACAAFERGAKTIGRESLTGISILMPESEVAREYLSKIMQQWQVTLGFYCTIRALPQAQFDRAYADGDYDIAFIKLPGGENTPEFFRQAEAALTERELFIPICYQSEMFFYNKKSRDLVFNPFTGVVCFRQGKYF